VDSLPGVGPPSTLKLEHPVWGIDPSTRRVALAILGPSGFELRSLSLPTAEGAQRLALARAALVPWFEAAAREHSPAWLWIEQPFARAKRVHPASYFMLAVVMEAAYTTLGLSANLIDPSSWKKQALGPGHGFAKKPEILRWAQGHGYTGQCGWCEPDRCKGGPAHDESDALGVATAGAVLVSDQVSAASGAGDGREAE
jgi:Holliday junction resolvasome RuvABC endonuclease subunit